MATQDVERRAPVEAERPNAEDLDRLRLLLEASSTMLGTLDVEAMLPGVLALAQRTLGRLTRWLSGKHYVGPLDLNLIVATNGDLYGLEWSPRCGFDALQAFVALLDTDSEVVRLYRLRGLPTTFLIDRRGLIRGVEIGFRDWASPASRTKLAELLR